MRAFSFGIPMTLREEITAKIDAYKAEIATLEGHLATYGAMLDKEETAFRAWFDALITKIRAAL